MPEYHREKGMLDEDPTSEEQRERMVREAQSNLNKIKDRKDFRKSLETASPY